MVLNERDRILTILLALVITTTLAFWSVRGHDFVNIDDGILVYENKPLQPDSKQGVLYFWKQPHEQLYMPLTYTVWTALARTAQVSPPTSPTDRPASGVSPDLDPNIFHSFNLLLHILSVLFLFALLRSLVGNDWAAGAGALLFGLHPVQVESVAWVSEMKGLLSGFFGLLALWLYVCYIKSSHDGSANSTTDLGSVVATAPTETNAPNRQYVALYYVLALLAFVLALLSKPSAVCLPIIAGLLDYWLRRRPRTMLLSIAPWLLATLPIVLMARSAQFIEPFGPIWTRPLIALDALAFYMGKLVWPVNLFPEYNRAPAVALQNGWAYWSWIAPAILGVLLWWQRKRRPQLALGALIFVAALLPVLGFVPFTYQHYSTVADRYVYLAMLGPALALAATLACARSRTLVASTVALLAILGVLTARQVTFWKNSSTLNTHTVCLNPQAYMARINMGITLEAQGDLKQATSYYQEAIRLKPNFPEGYINLGAMRYKQKRTEEAIELLVKAVELSPTAVVTYRTLFQAYEAIGKDKYALLALRRAEQLEPEHYKTQMSLAGLYLRQKKYKEAQAHFTKAEPLAPTPASHNVSVAMLLTKYNLFTSSIPYYVAALQHRPDDPKLHNDLGATLFRLRDYKPAVAAFNNALKIKPDYAEAHSNLGLVFLQQGRKREAETQFRKALQFNPDLKAAQEALQKLRAS